MNAYINIFILLININTGFAEELRTMLDRASKASDLSALEEVKQLAIQEGDQLITADAYHIIGYINWEEHRFFDAIVNYQEAIKIYQEIGDYKKLSTILVNLAVVYDVAGSKQMALDYYNEAESLKTNLGDSTGLMTVNYNIGKVYQHLEKLDTALIFYQRSLELAKMLKNKFIGRIYNDMGTLHRKLEAYDMAFNYYDLADRYDSSVVMQARTLNNRGYAHLEKGNRELALHYFRQALRLDPSKVQDRTLSIIYSNLRDMQALPDSTLDFYEKSFQYIKDKSLSLIPEYFETSKELRKLYKANGDIDKVEEHYVLQEKFTQDLVDLQNELQSLVVQYQIEAATWKVERDHKTEELQVQNRILLYSLAGLLLTTFGLVVYFFQVRKHQKNERHIVMRAKEVYKILKA